MIPYLREAWRYAATRASCCVVGCGCAVVVITPVLGATGVGTYYLIT